jgi:hypothetical protein
MQTPSIVTHTGDNIIMKCFKDEFCSDQAYNLFTTMAYQGNCIVLLCYVATLLP